VATECKKDTKKKDYLPLLEKIIDEIRYGSVTLIVQDGKVIQIDTTEKIRL